MNPENGSANTNCVCTLNVNNRCIWAIFRLKLQIFNIEMIEKRGVQNSFNFANYPWTRHCRRPRIFCVQRNIIYLHYIIILSTIFHQPEACSQPIFQGRGDQLFPVVSGGWSGCPRQFWVDQRCNGEGLFYHSHSGRGVHSCKKSTGKKNQRLVKSCSYSLLLKNSPYDNHLHFFPLEGTSEQI